MTLNLIQLRTFCRLARETNFTRTAEALDLTQPAVTQHVRALQNHVGLKLVDVTGHRTTLTDAGVFFAKRAEEVLGNVASLEREMREFADLHAGELRIGASVTIGTYRLPAIVARFCERFPDIRLLVEVENTEAVVRSLLLGRIAVALVEGPLAGDEFDIVAYERDELILIGHAGHDLASRAKPVRLAELGATPFIFREGGSGTRAQIVRAFEVAGIAPDIVLTLPTGEAIVRAVELRMGVAIVSRVVAEDAIALGRIAHIPLRGSALARTFRSVRLRNKTASPAAAAFVSMLRVEARARLPTVR